jgi:hypothetical protein
VWSAAVLCSAALVFAVWGLECGSALLCRFGFSFGFCFRQPHAPETETVKPEKPKRQSKALPHSTPKKNNHPLSLLAW